MKARFCPHCGAGTSNDYVFCPNCGTRLPDLLPGTGPAQVPEKAKAGAPVAQKMLRNENVAAVAVHETSEALVCPTCGFQNLAGSRSCKSCGAFLKGADRIVNPPESRSGREDSPGSENPKPDSRHDELKESLLEKEKRRNPNSSTPFPGKKFRLTTTQAVAIGATFLLGAILVYGIVTTKSVSPRQDNAPGPDAQQQAANSPPSADVLHEIDRLRQVVEKNPSDLVSALQLSNMLQDNGFYDQAVVYYRRYLDKVPDNADARVDYGVTLFESGHIEDAITQLTRALQINPKHQIGYFNLGIVYLNAGKFDQADTAFKKCVSIDPSSDIGKKAEQTLEQHASTKN
jgi:cytochrome c-type biogenesis protein CcmH/NrfG/ribosomal protein L32